MVGNVIDVTERGALVVDEVEAGAENTDSNGSRVAITKENCVQLRRT